MAYDERLAARLRELLGDRDDVAEKRMFGGAAFLVGGHLAVCASHTGGLLARVDPQDAEDLNRDPHVEPMVMRGRPMAGWLRVADEAIGDHTALEGWVARSVAFVERLPPKG